MPGNRADVSRTIDRRMALAREWDELVTRARHLPGFEDFLRPPRLESLLPAATGGRIVVVNVSRRRCDALIVTVDGVRIVELRELTEESVTDRATSYLRVLHDAERAYADYDHARRHVDGGDRSYDAVRARDAAAERFLAAKEAREEELQDVMAWLWEVVVEPVLARLDHTETPPNEPWPRVWWCPTGLLTLLPLHAAGRHGADVAETSANVLDRVISSYTPTIRALLEARRPRSAAGGEDRMLVVAVPDPADRPRLVSVEWARARLTELLPNRHTLLDGDEATPETVLSDLRRHRWVHFGCHGDQDLTDPSHGGLQLRTRTLTIAEISDQRYDGDFAFLAACKTAIGGVHLPDEAITLTAAMHSPAIGT
jgi:hypothetical protein